MAETGEPYATARREVIGEHKAAGGQVPFPGPKRFAISYDSTWLDTVLNRALRIGPDVSGAEIDSDELRVRMGWAFRLDIPRGSVRSASRSQARVGRTRGVHGRSGRHLVNGSADGLVELAIEPPGYLERGLSTLFRKEKVTSLTLSLADPDGFLAALEHA